MRKGVFAFNFLPIPLNSHLRQPRCTNFEHVHMKSHSAALLSTEHVHLKHGERWGKITMHKFISGETVTTRGACPFASLE